MINNSVLPYILEAHLVDHCNLNCNGCSHFAPLVQAEVFLDAEIFLRDLKRMSEIYQDIYEIRLMGGEPLLHPKIIDFIKFSRQTYPQTNISISTNGMLLTKMPEHFWQACVENKAFIKITNYPIKLDLEKIVQIGKLHQVRIKIPKRITEFFQFINIKGDSDPRKSFRTCRAMYTTPFIRDGKLYSCSFAPHVHLFNDYFKQEIPVSENDSINIFEDVNSDEINKFLANPIPLCSWCKTQRPYSKWDRSRHEINEWTSAETNNRFYFVELAKYKMISTFHQLKQESEMKKRTNYGN
jgi:hypothetical protein